MSVDLPMCLLQMCLCPEMCLFGGAIGCRLVRSRDTKLPGFTALGQDLKRIAARQTSVERSRVKSARAKVVRGKIMPRANFPEGAKLTILMDDDCPPIAVDAEDEAASLRGVADGNPSQ